MNPPPENFDALRRLLILKRHEQPPPGYFESFSSQVVLRIRAGERGEPASLLSRILGGATWWSRVWAGIESRPGFAGAFGAAACALLISGIVYSENAPVPAIQALVPGESSGLFTTVAVAANDAMVPANLMSGTNGMIASGDSLFNQLQFPKLEVEPANLLVPGN